jgi:chemotaxis-related protein WspB
MQALVFRAGPHRFAVASHLVCEVLPRIELRPVALAPAGVIGLLPYRGALVPVVDLVRIVLARDAAPLRSSRIIVLEVDRDSALRRFGLLAEDVVDLVDARATQPGLRLTDQGWMGDHLTDAEGLPQLVDPERLLPDELARLFRAPEPP